jgi:hypothetical protein
MITTSYLQLGATYVFNHRVGPSRRGVVLHAFLHDTDAYATDIL